MDEFEAFLQPRLAPVLLSPTCDAACAQATAAALAESFATVPGGVFSSPDINAAGADLLVTYRNFGEVDINGFDVSAAFLITDKLQIGATASLISDYYFNLPVEGGADQPVALNAPKEKGTATLTYRDADGGFNGELRARFNGEFPANSAGYIGLQCIDSAAVGECVDSYTLLDLNLGYELRQLPGASIQLNVSNVLDEDYQSFIGVATVGRLALLRLRYEF
jgi:outer membrane receptor protein involved in Fe transport